MNSTEIDCVLFKGEFPAFSIVDWTRYLALCEEIKQEHHKVCHLIESCGGPTPGEVQSAMKKIVDLLNQQIANHEILGFAIVAEGELANGFARMVQLLLPEDFNFLVTHSISKAENWKKDLPISKEITIPLDSAA